MQKQRYLPWMLSIIALLAVLLPGSALAQSPGELDPTFGGDGLVTTNILNENTGQVHAIVLQPDSKIVATGYSNVGGIENFALVRYNPNGSLDSTFGEGGKVITDFNGAGGLAYALTRQPDGKLVVAGPASSGFGLARYNPDGSLDPTFDGDGKVITVPSGGLQEAWDIIVQPDGKIVVAGYGDESNNDNVNDYNFILVRYNSDGSLDPSFDGDGKVSTDFGRNNDDLVRALALQPDGKMVVAGYSNSEGFYGFQFALARYNSDGSLDPTFDGDGLLTTDFGGNGHARDLALQPNGKILVAGFSDSKEDGNYKFALARYNPDGSLDPSFNGDGKLTTSFSHKDMANALILQPDGKILVAGDFALARYNSNGSLDSAFGKDGLITKSGGFYALALQPNGKIVGAGGGFTLARYNPNGSLDSSFDGDGLVNTPLGKSDDYATALALQPDGKILAAGYSHTFSGDIVLTRYKTDGSLDPTFDGDGKVITGAGGKVYALALQPDCKSLIAGVDFGPTHNDFVLARYNSDGSLDSTFDGDGKVITNFAVISPDTAYDLTLQPDGRIVAAGISHNDFALARYNPNGSLDPTLDGDGKTTTNFGGYSLDHAQSLILQPDGKIVVAGYSSSDYIVINYDFALVRYNPNGSLDSTFDGDGKVITNFSSSVSDHVYAVVLQPDGKIVVAGYSNNGDDDFALARYNPNGSLDSTFDGDGKTTTDFNNHSLDRAHALVLQLDGKLLVAGISNNAFALARYNSNGSLDSTFDGDGKVTTHFSGSYNDIANALAWQHDGKLILAGMSYLPGWDFALARYLVPDWGDPGSGSGSTKVYLPLLGGVDCGP